MTSKQHIMWMSKRTLIRLQLVGAVFIVLGSIVNANKKKVVVHIPKQPKPKQPNQIHHHHHYTILMDPMGGLSHIGRLDHHSNNPSRILPYYGNNKNSIPPPILPYELNLPSRNIPIYTPHPNMNSDYDDQPINMHRETNSRNIEPPIFRSKPKYLRRIPNVHPNKDIFGLEDDILESVSPGYQSYSHDEPFTLYKDSPQYSHQSSYYESSRPSGNYNRKPKNVQHIYTSEIQTDF